MKNKESFNEKAFYAKQSIELAEEAKQSIVVPSNIIIECNDDRLLGMRVRGMLINKVRECDEHITYMKSLIENGKGKSNL
jgi:hypothetical protein